MNGYMKFKPRNCDELCWERMNDEDEWIKSDLVNSSPADWSDLRALYRSSAIIRNFEKRKQYPEISSPPSCLKSICSIKKRKVLEKRVNFCDEPLNHQKSPHSFSHSTNYSDHPQYTGLNECSSNTRKKSHESGYNSRKNFFSSPDRMLERSLLSKRSPSLRKHIAHDSNIEALKNVRRPNEDRKSIAVSATEVSPRDSLLDSSVEPMPKRLIKKEATRSKSHDEHSCRSSSAMNVDKDLLEVFNRMSLNSSTRCSSGVSIDLSQRPRVVKPRDGFKRAALKRMLIYPPKDQRGPPLTLLKSWSNIDCQVKGSDTKGFRYKVYYIQKFESDTWFPNEKTGNPFRKKEDDCSTDYG